MVYHNAMLFHGHSHGCDAFHGTSAWMAAKLLARTGPQRAQRSSMFSLLHGSASNHRWLCVVRLPPCSASGKGGRVQKNGGWIAGCLDVPK